MNSVETFRKEKYAFLASSVSKLFLLSFTNCFYSKLKIELS